MTTHRSSAVRPGAVLLGASLVLAAGYAVADDGAATLDALAKALVTKRASVERLSAKLELEKAQQRDELRRQSQQRAELERQIKSVELELTELRATRAKTEAEVASATKVQDAIKPLLTAQLAAIQARVKAGIPFKRTERTAALQKLGARIKQGEVTPEEALGRLWSSLEDELRLTRENGLYRQRIQLDGDAQLADVVKLGMVLMYFRTLDGRVGLVTPGDQDWRYRVTTDPQQQAQIKVLFEALEKHVRSGYFEVPNPYAVSSKEQG